LRSILRIFVSVRIVLFYITIVVFDFVFLGQAGYHVCSWFGRILLFSPKQRARFLAAASLHSGDWLL